MRAVMHSVRLVLAPACGCLLMRHLSMDRLSCIYVRLSGLGLMPDRDLAAALNEPVSVVKAELFKALAHPARVRALEVLVEGERSVGEMQPLVGIELSHLSQQLGVLRRAGLVSTRRVGTTVIYTISNPFVSELLGAARRVLIGSLSQTQDLLADLRAAGA